MQRCRSCEPLCTSLIICSTHPTWSMPSAAAASLVRPSEHGLHLSVHKTCSNDHNPCSMTRLATSHLHCSRVLSEELTPGVWAALMIEEGQHWAATYGPRMALYEGNERALRLLTHDTSGGRRQAESARAQQVQAGASAAGKNLQQQQPASSAPLWSTKPLQQTQGQRRRGSGHVGKESSVQLQLSATSGTTSAPHHQQQLQVVLPSKL
jgi:hypothetical protein